MLVRLICRIHSSVNILSGKFVSVVRSSRFNTHFSLLTNPCHIICIIRALLCDVRFAFWLITSVIITYCKLNVHPPIREIVHVCLILGNDALQKS